MFCALLLLSVLSISSCSNSKEDLENMSQAVEGYCTCIDKVAQEPELVLEKAALLELEQKLCGNELAAIAEAQKEITVPGEEVIHTIRKRQQDCYYKFRDAN